MTRYLELPDKALINFDLIEGVRPCDELQADYAIWRTYHPPRVCIDYRAGNDCMATHVIKCSSVTQRDRLTQSIRQALLDFDAAEEIIISVSLVPDEVAATSPEVELQEQ